MKRILAVLVLLAVFAVPVDARGEIEIVAVDLDPQVDNNGDGRIDAYDTYVDVRCNVFEGPRELGIAALIEDDLCMPLDITTSYGVTRFYISRLYHCPLTLTALWPDNPQLFQDQADVIASGSMLLCEQMDGSATYYRPVPYGSQIDVWHWIRVLARREIAPRRNLSGRW